MLDGIGTVAAGCSAAVVSLGLLAIMTRMVVAAACAAAVAAGDAANGAERMAIIPTRAHSRNATCIAAAKYTYDGG